MSSTYKVLKQIYDHQIILSDGIQYITISQAELSRIIGVSTITMNKYFNIIIIEKLEEELKEVE